MSYFEQTYIANTGWIEANTSLTKIINTAGVMVGNSIAIAGTAIVTVENFGAIGGGYSYASSADWTVGDSGSAVWAVNSATGQFTPFYLDADNNLKTTASVAVGAVSATIVNSGNWILSVANTSLSYNVSATIINSAGWYVISSATILNSGNWIISVANTGWIEANTALVKLINTGAVLVGNSLALAGTTQVQIMNTTSLSVKQSGIWNANIVSQPTALAVTQWATTNMSTNTGNILTSAANGSCYRIFHIACNNEGLTDTNFWLVNSNGNQLRRYCLTRSGGTVEAQLNPPVLLSNSGNLYYNYVNGGAGDINITIHYILTTT